MISWVIILHQYYYTFFSEGRNDELDPPRTSECTIVRKVTPITQTFLRSNLVIGQTNEDVGEEVNQLILSDVFGTERKINSFGTEILFKNGCVLVGGGGVTL